MRQQCWESGAGRAWAGGGTFVAMVEQEGTSETEDFVLAAPQEGDIPGSEISLGRMQSSRRTGGHPAPSLEGRDFSERYAQASQCHAASLGQPATNP